MYTYKALPVQTEEKTNKQKEASDSSLQQLQSSTQVMRPCCWPTMVGLQKVNQSSKSMFLYSR